MTYFSVCKHTQSFVLSVLITSLLGLGAGCSDSESDAAAESVRSHTRGADTDSKRDKPKSGKSDSDVKTSTGHSSHMEAMQGGSDDPAPAEGMPSESMEMMGEAQAGQSAHADSHAGGAGGAAGSDSGDSGAGGRGGAGGSDSGGDMGAGGVMSSGGTGGGGGAAGSSNVHDHGGQPTEAGSGGSAGSAGAARSAGAPVSEAGSRGSAGAAGGGGSAGAAGAAGEAGMGGMGGMGGSAGSAGAAGGPAMDDHCVLGEVASALDATVTSKPDYWTDSMGRIDLVLPKGVLDWMGARAWERSHNAWHNIRRCSSGSTVPRASVEICGHTELVPASQECSGPDDGYQFLVMHRHMIRALKQAFPTHQDLFDGFPNFPFEATDVPEEWRDRFGTGWSQTIINTATILEDIENQLDRFPTEGSVGQYIQCGGMGSITNIHGALHFKWVVNESPYSLGKQTVNIDNYMFWKLHGWIDGIWERYRRAKGLTQDDETLTAELVDQCHEMHALGMALAPPPVNPPPDPDIPTETGLFVETVRPIFDQICSGCHSESSPEAGMSLGGKISSSDVVSNLVNVQAMHGGQFMRIVPGAPQQSWLYLKVSGMAAAAGCTGTACNPQTMPPTGQVTLTQAQLDAIKTWIEQGAPAPTPAQ